MWDWIKPRWDVDGFELCVGIDDDHGEPFNISRAFNRARAQATGDWLMCFGADEVPDPDHLRKMAALHSGRPWFGTYHGRALLSEEATDRVLDGTIPWPPPRHWIRVWRPRARTQIAVRPDVWDDIGGWDEGFAGWGSDDEAVRAALVTLHGPPPTAQGWLYTLWHPPSDRSHVPTNQARMTRYTAALNNPSAMRAVIADR